MLYQLSYAGELTVVAVVPCALPGNGQPRENQAKNCTGNAACGANGESAGLRRAGFIAHLDTQNARPKYIETFINELVNWDFVNQNLSDAK